MILYHDPDAWVTTHEFEQCSFHKKDPGASHPGCMCHGGFGQRPATPEEYAANRRARLRAERERLVGELDRVERQLKE